MEGIYLVWTREFRNQNSKVYKVGRTSQGIQVRLRGYPKGSQLMMWQPCPNTKIVEKTILDRLDKKFQKKPEYGREYFEGEESEIISEINDSIRARAALERTKAAISSSKVAHTSLPSVEVDYNTSICTRPLKDGEKPGRDIMWMCILYLTLVIVVAKVLEIFGFE